MATYTKEIGERRRAEDTACKEMQRVVDSLLLGKEAMCLSGNEKNNHLSRDEKIYLCLMLTMQLEELGC